MTQQEYNHQLGRHMTSSALKKEMRSKSTEELEQIVRTAHAIEITESLLIALEFERRLHQIEFHGREGNAEEMQNHTIKAWQRFQQTLAKA